MTWTPPPSTVTLEVTMPTPRPFLLDPTTTGVIVVDMEQYFLTDPKFPDRMSDTIEPNAALIAKARAAGAPVIYIQSVRTPQALEVTRFGCDPILLEGSPGVEIAPAIAPLPDEPVVQKWGHDPWAGTTLEQTIKAAGLEPGTGTLLVTGVSAAVCAHACALGASNRHYMTLIPMDCTAAGSVEDEAAVYHQYMRPGYAFNVDITRSDLVEFTPGAPAPEAQR